MRLRWTLLGAILAAGLAPHASFTQIASAPAVAGVILVDARPVVEVDYTNPGLSPSHWTLTLHPDGSGRFHSQMGNVPTGTPQQIDAPDLDREIQLSATFAERVFRTAKRHKLFSEDCDSHMKVAFQGWKKLSYSGAEGRGTCTYNYTKDKEIGALGDSLEAVAQTIMEGARLEMLLQHDRLGLDREMEFLVDAAGSGRAQQICAIRQILVRLADDDAVLERVRKQARQLLARADS
jgi:hypothetical protein